MESLRVLSALGDRGWVCRVSTEQNRDAWVERVRECGWVPVDVIVQAPGTAPATGGQDDVHINVPTEDLLAELGQRFPPGRPLHQLVAHAIEPPLVAAIAARFRPWTIGTDPNIPLEELAGYRMVAGGDLRWWLRADLGHLAPSLTTLDREEIVVESRRPSTTDRIAGRLRPLAIRLAHKLPGPVSGRLVRRRHLDAVKANVEHLINPAYRGHPGIDHVTWLSPSDLPEVPVAATAVAALDERMREEVRLWLADPHDSDAMLNRRMDNHGDELGRTRAALRTRLAIPTPGNTPFTTLDRYTHGRVVVDVRCLQSPSFGLRGIGRFALSVVTAVRSVAGDENVLLLIDPTLESLPDSVTGGCACIRVITPDDVAGIGALIQPSPMTASPDPFLPALLAGTPSLAVVYDFIPAHYPTVYLSHPAARSEYAAQLDALALYGEYLAISHTAAVELANVLLDRGRSEVRCEVAWPRAISRNEAHRSMSDSKGPIIVMTGDEPRKNTFGALAAVGVATAGERPPRNVIVIGMAGHATRVHHLSIAAAMRPGEARVAHRIDDAELADLMSTAGLVVVASFDEGLSLPIIEALHNGAPVVASDIPAHRELVGAGDYLAPADDIEALSKAIRVYRGKRSVHRRQAERLAAHRHTTIEDAINRRLRQTRPTVLQTSFVEGALGSRRPRVAVATPWLPQATGVADFSAATIAALQEHVDLTVYSSSGAGFGEPLDDLIIQSGDFDVIVAVAGNSHFHLPIMEVLAQIRATSRVPTIVIAHDTRMVEYYMALRGSGGAEAVMLRGQAERRLSPSLEEQIEDMRLLQNAGFWELAHLADRLVLHSVGAAARIEQETGVAPVLLPFANQRVPDVPSLTSDMRKQARESLEVPEDVLFLGSFGYADSRTKLTDVVVEAGAWLTQWGHTVSLHLVGAASPDLKRSLERRAKQAQIHDFRITGFADEDLFRRYLLGIDAGVQLRVSPVLGVSGPLSDMAAFGTRAVASRGLAIDVDVPDFIHRLPDAISPLLVAEAVEKLVQTHLNPIELEQQRQVYLGTKTPQEYAARLAREIQELLR